MFGTEEGGATYPEDTAKPLAKYCFGLSVVARFLWLRRPPEVTKRKLVSSLLNVLCVLWFLYLSVRTPLAKSIPASVPSHRQRCWQGSCC
ncbi:hypothetical protein VNO80_29378 [Phaseolus coccineus]|uniref:Uncharacterized protein n=1 Tax=Phaseolus coccineus TaxID=3886 RepID=A0AAN9LEA0_PHACN